MGNSAAAIGIKPKKRRGRGILIKIQAINAKRGAIHGIQIPKGGIIFIPKAKILDAGIAGGVNIVPAALVKPVRVAIRGVSLGVFWVITGIAHAALQPIGVAHILYGLYALAGEANSNHLLGNILRAGQGKNREAYGRGN